MKLTGKFFRLPKLKVKMHTQLVKLFDRKFTDSVASE